MKDTPLSNCERDFLLQAIQEKKVSCLLNVSHLDVQTYEAENYIPPRYTAASGKFQLTYGIFVCDSAYKSKANCFQSLQLNVSVRLSDSSLQRLDGRQTYDYRKMKIKFGTDYGCCFVDLGKTR